MSVSHFTLGARARRERTATISTRIDVLYHGFFFFFSTTFVWARGIFRSVARNACNVFLHPGRILPACFGGWGRAQGCQGHRILPPWSSALVSSSSQARSPSPAREASTRWCARAVRLERAGASPRGLRRAEPRRGSLRYQISTQPFCGCALMTDVPASTHDAPVTAGRRPRRPRSSWGTRR
jgi:hypothetical protein